MAHLGEIILLAVAVSWTATALFADEASHRLGSLAVNVIRLVLGTVFLGLILWFTIGTPYPRYADGATWFWLALSALVGYLFGDFCLFNSYMVIGARFGQLFMTLAPPMAAIAGWAMLGETLSWRSMLAMAVTIAGIAISILSRDGNGHKVHFTLPLKGILLGLGAGAGIASTLMALTPVLIILPYSIIHKQRVKAKEIIGVAVSMLGVAMFFLL